MLGKWSRVKVLGREEDAVTMIHFLLRKLKKLERQGNQANTRDSNINVLKLWFDA